MNISDEELKAYEERQRQKFYEEWKKDTERKQLEQIEKSLDESGLRESIRTKTFDSFIAEEPWQQKAKGICERYADNPNGWLFISGPSGCGKTHLCTAVVGRLIDQGIPVRYMLYRQEIGRLKPMSDNKVQAKEDLQKLKTCRLLYIDDLFKGGTSGSEIRIMFDLLDFRYRGNLKTIISTELSSEQLTEIDEAIAGRILEKSRKVLINSVPGRNYRLKNKNYINV